MRLLGSPFPHVGVFQIAWSRYLRQYGMGGPPPFLRSLLPATAVPGPAVPNLRDELLSLPAPERPVAIARFLTEQIGRALGFAADYTLDPEQRFGDLGVDSLLAVDVRNRLEAALRTSLPATLLFDYPDLAALSAHLALELGPEAPPKDEDARRTDTGTDADTAAEDADDDLARRLRAKVDALSARERKR
jgi:acyl carrier protein